jgi:ubiquinone/menaquinone biosynthesis C-methylase UbiE
MPAQLSWEEAVLRLRDQGERAELVRQCYYDDPVEKAAERFHAGEEWRATRDLLAGHLPGRVLDLGAGRGIASFAFARAGCSVTALEPDASAVVGRGAIERLREETGLDIVPVEGRGEALPFGEEQFDVVYGRAVLHHALNLSALCRESARVLRPGGVALWVREHVISRSRDLAVFLRAHPLHHFYGGEKAYRLEEYCRAIRSAGLRLRALLGPLESPINYWPMTTDEVQELLHQRLGERLGGKLARMVLCCPGIRAGYARWLSRRMDEPGRHFAFLGVKPWR